MGYFEEIGFQVLKRGVDFILDITGREHSVTEIYEQYKSLPHNKCWAMINRIQNKSVHNVYVCVYMHVNIFYVYTVCHIWHKYSIYIENIYMYIL